MGPASLPGTLNRGVLPLPPALLLLLLLLLLLPAAGVTPVAVPKTAGVAVLPPPPPPLLLLLLLLLATALSSMVLSVLSLPQCTPRHLTTALQHAHVSCTAAYDLASDMASTEEDSAGIPALQHVSSKASHCTNISVSVTALLASSACRRSNRYPSMLACMAISAVAGAGAATSAYEAAPMRGPTAA
jgi:hypothetical protein